MGLLKLTDILVQSCAVIAIGTFLAINIVIPGFVQQNLNLGDVRSQIVAAIAIDRCPQAEGLAAQQILHRLALAPGLLKGREALVVGIVNQTGLPGLLLHAGKASPWNILDFRFLIKQPAIVRCALLPAPFFLIVAIEPVADRVEQGRDARGEAKWVGHGHSSLAAVPASTPRAAAESGNKKARRAGGGRAKIWNLFLDFCQRTTRAVNR